jgi:membrane-bound ClpP family serine protease
LSEQARIASLQEKIQNAKNNGWIGFLLSAIGIVLILVGAYLVFFPNPSVSIEDIGLVVFLGVIVMLAGGAIHSFYENKRIKLVKETKATTIKNPRALPLGNYTFCPFCGSPITPSF